MHYFDPQAEAEILAFHVGEERGRLELVGADPGSETTGTYIRRAIHQRPRISRAEVKQELSTDYTEALMQGAI